MALNPRFAGQKLAAGISPHAIHTLELYLDYVCPFSKKMFSTLYTSVIPTIETKYKEGAGRATRIRETARGGATVSRSRRYYRIIKLG